jgi:hypothetical protein
MRVIHDSWALLQDMASEVFTIIKVNTNMGHILNGYGLMGAFPLQ